MTRKRVYGHKTYSLLGLYSLHSSSKRAPNNGPISQNREEGQGPLFWALLEVSYTDHIGSVVSIILPILEVEVDFAGRVELEMASRLSQPSGTH